MSDGSSPDAGVTAGSRRIGRRSLLRGLTAVGAVVAVTGAMTIGSETPALAAQSGWRWCRQCQGLWYAGNRFSLCPAPSFNGRSWPHSSNGSGNYNLYRIGEGGNQHEWRWCQNCQGLWFSGNGTNGNCAGTLDWTTAGKPAPHSMSGSGNYQLAVNGSPFDSPPAGQDGWYWCLQCQGLWYGLNGPGYCPIARGASHSRINSGFYFVPKD